MNPALAYTIRILIEIWNRAPAIIIILAFMVVCGCTNKVTHIKSDIDSKITEALIFHDICESSDGMLYYEVTNTRNERIILTTRHTFYSPLHGDVGKHANLGYRQVITTFEPGKKTKLFLNNLFVQRKNAPPHKVTSDMIGIVVIQGCRDTTSGSCWDLEKEL